MNRQPGKGSGIPLLNSRDLLSHWGQVMFTSLWRLAGLKPRGWIKANPNPIPVRYGTFVGETMLSWKTLGASTVEVRAGAPDGALLARTSSSGSQLTGRWVTDGMTFYLQDASGEKGHDRENTLAVCKVGISTAGVMDVYDAIKKTVKELIRKELGCEAGEIVVAPCGGCDSIVLEASSGAKSAFVKVSLQADDGSLRVEKWAHGFARRLGVPAARVLGSGQVVGNQPREYLITERVEGLPLSGFALPPAEVAAIMAKAETILSRLHAVRADGYGPVDADRLIRQGCITGRLKTWEDAVRDRVDGALDFLVRNHVLKRQTAISVSRSLVAHGDLLSYGARGSLLHGDFHAGHIFVNEIGHKVSGVVDLGNVMVGDPLWDRATFIVMSKTPTLETGYQLDSYAGREGDTDMVQLKLLMYCACQIVVGARVLHEKGALHKMPGPWKDFLDKFASRLLRRRWT